MVIIRKKENKSVQKVKMILVSSLTSFSVMCVNVCAKPSFSESGFKGEAQSWTDPIMNFLLWVTVPVGLISSAGCGIFWLMKDEEYKEQHPLKKRITPILIATIIIELIPTIFKLLNLK